MNTGQDADGAGIPAQDPGARATALARLVAEGRFAPGLGVTCRGKTDGAGAQAMAVISAMAMARFIGAHYFHSPFRTMAHAEGTPAEWAQRWERFLNLGDGEAPAPADRELVQLSDALRNPSSWSGRPVIIVSRWFHLPKADGTRIGDALRAELRTKYRRSPKVSIPLHRSSDRELVIAIHLRRGDVSAVENAARHVPDARVLRQIDRLRHALAPFARPVRFNLYSEGDPGDFRTFADAGCRLYVSADPFETFHNMVGADILLGAYSTFSYLAALLSEGIVLDHRVRAPAHSGWIGRRGDGDISIKRLRLALLEGTGWKDRAQYRVRLWRQIWNEHPAGR